jgi:hypothetical protein
MGFNLFLFVGKVSLILDNHSVEPRYKRIIKAL